MKIRESTAGDKPAIYQLHLDTFDETEAEAVAQLALELLEDETATPLLSLVAQEQGKIIGHILFTSVTVSEATAAAGSTQHNGYILAPLAVTGQHQREGIGSALIRQGIDLLKQRNAGFILVLGDPAYYSRSGFKTGHSISPPYELAYPEAWMAMELEPGVLKDVKGTVQCAESLSSPALW